ncbi:hypothetical protein [Muricoccus radiodurans]|uniref:hypothetical protein n=1 Tax=Muricoccus radiodurans TaxID=2231721 RepID=UPI003CE6D5D3
MMQRSLPRRLALVAPLAIAACGPGAPAPPLAPRIEGYAYLTPLRLNVADLEVVPALPGPASRTDPPAPRVPAEEVARMGRDRIVPSGSANRARFIVETATLVREGNRISVLLRARVEILEDDRRVAFAEAEARRTEGGANTNAEAIVARAMSDLNVEFELQVRRNLRDWLITASPTGPAEEPGPVQREDLPRG